jgi:hypothetical protein
MAKHKYLSNFDCYSLQSGTFFGLLDCDCTPKPFLPLSVYITMIHFDVKMLFCFENSTLSTFKNQDIHQQKLEMLKCDVWATQGACPISFIWHDIKANHTK